MDNHGQFEGITGPRGSDKYEKKYAQLAHWLQQILPTSPTPMQTLSPEEGDIGLELLLSNDYHLRFYQQLPDFVMALLSDDPRATTRYAPLLYHLAACHECHKGYLELYDAMHAAVQPRRARQVLGQGTRTLAATPQRMLGHFCQTLITQAEAILLQERNTRSTSPAEVDASARSLLQTAIRIGAHIGQSSIRRLAMHDLVRVATLFDGHGPPSEYNPAIRSYTPAMTGSSSIRGRKKIVRRAELLSRTANQNHVAIQLQSHTLEGSIIQNGSQLELQLHDLDEQLRGQHVTISVLLGSLLEPVRWLGGNPRAIRSQVPVDASGQLITSLGETELQLSNPEDRNLLEVIFLLLEVRA